MKRVVAAIAILAAVLVSGAIAFVVLDPKDARGFYDPTASHQPWGQYSGELDNRGFLSPSEMRTVLQDWKAKHPAAGKPIMTVDSDKARAAIKAAEAGNMMAANDDAAHAPIRVDGGDQVKAAHDILAMSPKDSFDQGERYYYGNAVPQDYATAYKWYLQAGNYPEAQFTLGYMSETGEGVPVDYQKAAGFYVRAANAGHAKAMRHIGDLYYYGHGIATNYGQALAWYRKAAANQDGLAMFDAGLIYFNGDGVAKDYDEARSWFSRAAAANDPYGMKFLCVMYGDGDGVAVDVQAAYDWCQKAQARARETGDDDIVKWTTWAIDRINNHSGSSYSAPSQAPSNPYAITQDPRFSPYGH